MKTSFHKINQTCFQELLITSPNEQSEESGGLFPEETKLYTAKMVLNSEYLQKRRKQLKNSFKNNPNGSVSFQRLQRSWKREKEMKMVKSRRQGIPWKMNTHHKEANIRTLYPQSEKKNSKEKEFGEMKIKQKL